MFTRFSTLSSLIFLLGFLLLGSAPAIAAGTPAGTTITNRATLFHSVPSSGLLSISSNVASYKVDELIDVEVTWQDSAPVRVLPGSEDQVLTFLVANTGNGNESFELGVDAALSGDDFDPDTAIIYLDDGDGIFSQTSDQLYATSGAPDLAADQSLVVFVVSDIPASLDGDLAGRVRLSATSETFVGLTDPALPGAGDSGTTAVRFPDGGIDAAIGEFLTEEPDPGPNPEPGTGELSLVKSVSINAPDMQTEPVPGAILSYQITAQFSGDGIAEDVIISDPVPNETTYQAGSLTLNGAPLTDAADDDSGTFTDADAGTINVHLGDMDATSSPQIITFEVMINP